MHFRTHSITDTNTIPALINITHQNVRSFFTTFSLNLLNKYLQFHTQKTVLYLTKPKLYIYVYTHIYTHVCIYIRLEMKLLED